MIFVYGLLLFSALSALAFFLILKSRNIHIWLIAYIKDLIRQRQWKKGPITHIHFAFVDHYEPFWGNADVETARAIVAEWRRCYPPLAKAHTDSDGQHPKHSFFYPVEEYDPPILDLLAEIKAEQLGDLEVHIHHHNDTAENLVKTLSEFTRVLKEQHGCLRSEAGSGVNSFAFIHGNWALDNSAGGDWCGVDNEIQALIDAGCYVDMTMPSAPSSTQTSIINSIYFARGKNGRRKSHNRGRKAAIGRWGAEDELLMVQGPLALNWRNRKFGILPKIESGDISGDLPPDESRIKIWEKCRICIPGAEEHLFIKVHTHGAQKDNMDMLFSHGFEDLWSSLEALYRDDSSYRLHYVTAREMYEKIHGLAQRTNSDT